MIRRVTFNGKEVQDIIIYINGESHSVFEGFWDSKIDRFDFRLFKDGKAISHQYEKRKLIRKIFHGPLSYDQIMVTYAQETEDVKKAQNP